jgi:hypothetical protein
MLLYWGYKVCAPTQHVVPIEVKDQAHLYYAHAHTGILVKVINGDCVS